MRAAVLAAAAEGHAEAAAANTHSSLTLDARLAKALRVRLKLRVRALREVSAADVQAHVAAMLRDGAEVQVYVGGNLAADEAVELFVLLHDATPLPEWERPLAWLSKDEAAARGPAGGAPTDETDAVA